MEPERMIDAEELEGVIREAKAVAMQYRKVTGRPLGITGEVAEYEAARILGLRLAPPRQDGYAAIRRQGGACKLQIKGRCILDKRKRSQRTGSIKLDKDWDGVLLVLLDEDFEPLEIFEASRAAISEALDKPGSRARNLRGALAISKFKSLAGGRPIWTREMGGSGEYS
jgi:hypothetical protein